MYDLYGPDSFGGCLFLVIVTCSEMEPVRFGHPLVDTGAASVVFCFGVSVVT